MKFSNFFEKRISNYLEETDHIKELLPIQEIAIPKILKKQNCIIVSSTGSGKTLCYVLPTLVNLQDIDNNQVLVLIPTNELSKQVYNVYLHYAKLFNNVTIYNAFNKHKSVKNISSQIIIANPYETIKLFKNGMINLSTLTTIIIDEADMIFDFFKDEWKMLFYYLKNNNNLQYCLFSATLHESLANSIKKEIPNTLLIQDKKDIWNNDNISHHLVNLEHVINITLEIKLKALNLLLKQINPFFALIFVNSKKDADIVYHSLLKQEYKVGVLYSELDHKIRKDVLLKANRLEYQILVCTDLAARGIDLIGVSDVISFDLPKDDIYYIHRAGRTGRGKYKGNSYIFNISKDVNKVLKLKDKLYFKKIKLQVK